MAATTLRASLVVVSLLALGQGLKLPSYIIGCSRNDPKLNECALNSAIGFFKTDIPVKGDRKYRVPVLDPLSITQLSINQPGLNIQYDNMKMGGLKDLALKEIRIDLSPSFKAAYDFVIPELKVASDYVIKGQLLVVPITGKGKTTMNWYNLTATMTHTFDLVTRKGIQYLEVKNTFITSEMTGFKAHMDGLFGGDKRLGDHMNEFLNENWRDIVKDLKPSFNAALSRVADQVYNNLCALVPYKDMFPTN